MQKRSTQKAKMATLHKKKKKRSEDLTVATCFTDYFDPGMLLDQVGAQIPVESFLKVVFVGVWS